MRASFYVDGFNLYHAIDRLGKPHLKWVSLWELAALVIPKRTQSLVSVTYFSAYSTHRPDREKRHRAYTAALEATGVEIVMGKFKLRPAHCHGCGRRWDRPEEKETDVNIAIHLIQDAYEDRFDIAYLVSGDSDLAPAVRMIARTFPSKHLVTVSPPKRPHSQDILAATGGRKLKLNESQIARCLLSRDLLDQRGKPIARPIEYDPPDA